MQASAIFVNSSIEQFVWIGKFDFGLTCKRRLAVDGSFSFTHFLILAVFNDSCLSFSVFFDRMFYFVCFFNKFGCGPFLRYL